MDVRVIVMALLVVSTTAVPRNVAADTEAVGGPFILETIFPAGGGTSTSPRYVLSGSVGLAVTDTSSSANATLQSGFWHGFAVVDRPDPFFSDGFE